MTERGILISNFDPKPAIQKNAENAKDWEYRDEAQFLYRMANLFKDRFLDPVLLTNRRRLPDPVISFDDLRNNRILAAYTLKRNAQGLLDEITFNTVHYEEKDGQLVWKYGRWAQLETLLHEQVHLLQENFLNSHKPGRVAHDKVFIQKCNALGLHPRPVIGSHMQVADGIFAQLMLELGLPRPTDVPRMDSGENPSKGDWFRPEKEKGKSTLKKYECVCGQKIRVGKENWPGAICKACGNEYVKSGV